MRIVAWITHFLIKWNQESYTLLRIRVIMGILIFLYYMMFSLSGIFYFYTKTTVLSFLDVVTDTILVYILGAMQAAPFKNPLFPVWALLLISFRSSFNSLSRYGTHFELRNVFKLLAVAYMNVTQGSKVWRIQFWFFWSLVVLKCFYRILASYRASKSLGHGRSSELLQVYMGPDHDQRNFCPESCNPDTMKGYKYLVYGELNQSSGNTGEDLRINDSWLLITLEKIWQCDDEEVLRSIKWRGNDMKDLCLAFSLSRLLRCRLEGVILHARVISMTRKLVCSRISTDNVDADKILFGILDLDVVFLRDYLYSSYPMFFTGGLLWLFFTVIVYLLKYSLACLVFLDFTALYLPGWGINKTLSHQRHSFNADTILTGTAMIFVLSMEMWEVLKYLASNWKRVLVVCRLVNSSKSCMRYLLRRMMFNSLDRVVGWTDSIADTGQYIFLQSFNYSAWKWKLMHLLTVGIVESKVNGTKLSGSIILRENVKHKVFQAFHSLPSIGLEVYSLPRDFAALLVSDPAARYWSACLEVKLCSHVILVWHIATSLCEMKLAQDLESSRFSFLRKYWSLRQRRYYVHEKLDGNLRTNNETANCLSRYCAYLLVSRPELLPGNIWVSKQTIQDTVQCAHEILKGCGSPQSMYDKLIAKAQEATLSGRQNIKLSGNILQQGAMLGKMLIDNENQESRWEILAKVWARLLVHIAPSSNAEAHAKHLDSGVEFVTVIWALFTHCGIEKSELWQEDAAPGSNISSSSPGPSGRKNSPVDATQVQQTTVTSDLPAAAQPNGQASDLEDDEDIPEIVVIQADGLEDG